MADPILDLYAGFLTGKEIQDHEVTGYILVRERRDPSDGHVSRDFVFSGPKGLGDVEASRWAKEVLEYCAHRAGRANHPELFLKSSDLERGM